MSFNNNFDLKKFKKIYYKTHIKDDDIIYKLFIDSIKDDCFLNKVIENNDKEGIPPALTFVSTYNDFILNNKKLLSKNFQSIIGNLWKYLFATLNGKLYKKCRTIDVSDKTSILVHATVFKRLTIKKVIRVNVENFLLATRPSIYIGNYKDIVKAISTHAISFEKDSNKKIYENIYEYLINTLFQEDEIAFNDKVTKYCGNLQDCLSSNRSLFLLDENSTVIKTWFEADKLKKSLSQEIENCITLIKDFDKSHKSSRNIFREKKLDRFYGIYCSKYSDKTLMKIAIELKNEFKRVRFMLTCYFKNKYRDVDYDLFGKISKNIKAIDDLLDICGSFHILKTKKGNKVEKGNLKILVYIVNNGTLNVVLVNSLLVKSEWPNNEYDSSSDNKLIEEASTVSNLIENELNALIKVFNCINLNKIVPLYRKKKNIIGLPYDVSLKTINEENAVDILTRQIYKNNNTQKAIYMRLTYNHNDIFVKDSSAMHYFDYLSLLVAYSHDFDKYTLWEFTNDEKVYDEYRNKIVDIAASKNKHIYYDDSLFTYSVADQASRFIDFNHLIGNDKPNFRYMQSHQHRLYSLWEFSSLCNAIIFGSSSMLLQMLLMKYIRRVSNTNFALSMIKMQQFTSNMYTRINVDINHLCFNPKGRNFPLNNIVFDKIGLIDAEEKSKNVFSVSWQHANLNNVQFFQKLSLFLSITSIVISIFAFAWVSATFISEQIDSKDGYDWQLLFEHVAGSSKFWFILLLSVILFLILAICDTLMDFVHYKNCNKNLARFLTEHDRKVKQTKIQKV